MTPKKEKKTPIVPKLGETSRKFDSNGDIFSNKREKTPRKLKKQENSRNYSINGEKTASKEKFQR